MIEIKPILIGAISGILASLFIIVITQLIGKYFQFNKKRRIKNICFYHLEGLRKRLGPTSKNDEYVFFSETKFNEIKTAWYVYDMLLANIDVMDPRKFEKTMEFYHHYSTNIEQIKSRLQGCDSLPRTGYLTHETFNKLKNRLDSALSELR